MVRISTNPVISDEEDADGSWYHVLTAPGPGAVAVIEVNCGSGKAVDHILRRILPTGERISGLTIGRIRYGRWNEEDLIVVQTSERTWEIQCHGGTVALNRICRDLQSDGVIQRSQDDVTAMSEDIARSANGAMVEDVRKLIQMTIANCLPYARSRRTAELILAQASNSLYRDLEVLLNPGTSSHSDRILVLRNFEKWKDVADHLTRPWRVVLAGAPNVGKSSLLNAIAGMERSIVCDQPGTTRDAVEVDALIDGWSFRFVDTAGIRNEIVGDIELQGIALSRREASQCDVLCLVFDDAAGTAEWCEQLKIASLPRNTVLVRNKSDLKSEQISVQSMFRHNSSIGALPTVNISAVTGEGLPELLQWIKLAVVPQEPAKETTLPLCSIYP